MGKPITAERIPDAFFLPVMQVKELLCAKILPIKQRKPGGLDVILQYSSGHTESISRQDLITNYTYINGRRINLKHWKNNKYIPIQRLVKQELRGAFIPPTYTLTVNSLEALDSGSTFDLADTHGAMLLCGEDRTSYRVVMKEDFKKQYIMYGNIKKSVMSDDRLYNKHQEILEQERRKEEARLAEIERQKALLKKRVEQQRLLEKKRQEEIERKRLEEEEARRKVEEAEKLRKRREEDKKIAQMSYSELKRRQAEFDKMQAQEEAKQLAQQRRSELSNAELEVVNRAKANGQNAKTLKEYTAIARLVYQGKAEGFVFLRISDKQKVAVTRKQVLELASKGLVTNMAVRVVNSKPVIYGTKGKISELPVIERN